jgi:hypothetical protein
MATYFELINHDIIYVISLKLKDYESIDNLLESIGITGNEYNNIFRNLCYYKLNLYFRHVREEDMKFITWPLFYYKFIKSRYLFDIYKIKEKNVGNNDFIDRIISNISLNIYFKYIYKYIINFIPIIKEYYGGKYDLLIDKYKLNILNNILDIIMETYYTYDKGEANKISNFFKNGEFNGNLNYKFSNGQLFFRFHNIILYIFYKFNLIKDPLDINYIHNIQQEDLTLTDEYVFSNKYNY